MESLPPVEVTHLLARARAGDAQAMGSAYSAVYDELKRAARLQLRRMQDNFETTALVHEAYLKLVGQQDVEFSDRAAFFAYAATAMRSVVVDHARSRLALKRGGGDTVQRVADLPDNINDGIRLDEDLLSLDSALTQLNEVDPQLARVVELRYFGGLSELQIAELTERSERSVRRDWQKARMFLLQMLQGN